MTHPDLEDVLSLRHATEVDDSNEVAALAVEPDNGDDIVCGYISEQGRVLAWRASNGGHVLYESAIAVSDDYDWDDVGTPRVYRFTTADEKSIVADARRLFLAQSLDNGAALAFAGWRNRIVALVPEEVGPKESKIIRTTADGDIEATHAYNLLDAFGKYAEWLGDLAAEFGGTDDKLAAGIETPDMTGLDPIASTIPQAWLMREAAEAQLSQARQTLKIGLAGLARFSKFKGSDSALSVSELARSLHTDRPNLSRAIKSAERDPEISQLLNSLQQDD